MGFRSLLKHIGRIGKDQGLPLAAVFGVPGADLVHTAVLQIQQDPSRSNDDAIQLTGAAIDEIDERTDDLETRVISLENRHADVVVKMGQRVNDMEKKIRELEQVADAAKKFMKGGKR